MRRTVLATMLVTLLSVQPGYAEPGPVGSWLMKEPVSMWTFGMSRLRNYFVRLRTIELKGVRKGVVYDWDQNRIQIGVWTDETFSEDRCGKILEAIRDGGGVVNGLTRSTGFDHSWYADSFGTIGYANPDAPKDYLSKLDKIIRVRADMSGGACQGRLVSTEVMFSKG